MYGQTPKPLTPAPTPTPVQSVDSDSGSNSSHKKKLTPTVTPTPVVKKTPTLLGIFDTMPHGMLTPIPTPTPKMPKMESAPGLTLTLESESPIFGSIHQSVCLCVKKIKECPSLWGAMCHFMAFNLCNIQQRETSVIFHKK